MDKEKNLKIRHPLVTNSFYLYLAQFADYGISLIALPFIARTLGPGELGHLALAQTFGIFVLLFMDFGFSISATRDIAKIKNDSKSLKKYFSKIFTFKLLLIPVILLFSIIIIFLIPIFQERPQYIFFITIGSIFQGLSPNWFFLGLEKMKALAISKIIFRSIGLAIILIFVSDKNDGWIIILSYAITSIFIFIFLLQNSSMIIGRIQLSKELNFKSIYENSKWILLITIIPIIHQNFSAFLLGSYVGPTKLGLFFGSNKIYRAFNTLYGPIGQAVFPRLVSSNEKNNIISKQLAKKILFILLSIGLFFFFILFIFSKTFILILLGDKFLEASKTLQLFGIVLPLTAISHVLGRQWMLVKGNEKNYGIILLISSIISFVSIILFIDFYHINIIPISLIIYEISTIILILSKKSNEILQ